jgi:membrane associated rhomboid family serine protease
MTKPPGKMPRERFSDFTDAVMTSFTVLAVLCGVKAVEVLFHLPLAQFGIIPRTGSGLWGILFGPLLHVNLTHLLANALPLFVLLVLLLSNPKYHPYRTLALIWTASGLGTWLIGRGHSVHIGASSIIFGLAAFLIVAGFLMRSWRSAAVAIFVLVAFGGIFYGVLPQAGPISWEGHLCGGVAGAWTAARTMRPR